ncbi:hypothetical protein ACVILJ_007832 [Bradyrhizobium diazoefficiens]
MTAGRSCGRRGDSVGRIIGGLQYSSRHDGHKIELAAATRSRTARHTFAFSRRIPPELCFIALPSSEQGRREGRARLAPASPCATKDAHGVDHRSRRTPGLPCAMGYGLLRALPGERCTIAPVALRMADARGPVGPRISPQDLTHRPRASGPHDFAVRARPRWDFESWRVLAPEAMRRRCRRRVVRASAPCSRFPALQCCPRPTPSRPSLPGPRFVTIAIRPLSRARVFRVYDKSEFR